MRLAGRLLLALVLTVPAVGMAEMSRRAVMLAWRGRQTVADVTEEKVGGRGTCTLRYRFRVEGSDAVYTYTDVTSDDVAVVVTRPVWEQAKRTGKVPIEYVPSAPWVNRPVDRPGPDGLACTTIGLAFCGLLATAAWVMVANDMLTLRQRRRLRGSQADSRHRAHEVR